MKAVMNKYRCPRCGEEFTENEVKMKILPEYLRKGSRYTYVCPKCSVKVTQWILKQS